MANKINRSNLGEAPFKIFKDESFDKKETVKPAYFYYPLRNVSSVPVFRNGIEKMNIFWPKHWWQPTTVVEVCNARENISGQKTLHFWQVPAFKNRYYPKDWDILRSVEWAFRAYLEKVGVNKNAPEASQAFAEFKTRIQDPYLRFQLEFRLGYLDWPNEGDPKVLKSPYVGKDEFVL